MSRTIDYIEIIVRPYTYAGPSVHMTEIRISVRTTTQSYNTIKIVDENDFESRFDYLIEAARRELLMLLRNEDSPT